MLLIIIAFSCITATVYTEYNTDFILPFDSDKYVIKSTFKIRKDPINGITKHHDGIDVVPSGTKNIIASAGGKVIISKYAASTYGEYVAIEHEINGKKYQTGYAHMEMGSRLVNAGDIVKQGQKIGTMGATGHATGPHLHFYLKEQNSNGNFIFVDPIIIFNNAKNSDENFTTTTGLN